MAPVRRRVPDASGSARRTGAQTDEWAAFHARLRRLEGQAHAIAEMVTHDRETLEVLQQFSAMIAASREAAVTFTTLRLRQRLLEFADEAAVDDLLAEIAPFLGRASRVP